RQTAGLTEYRADSDRSRCGGGMALRTRERQREQGGNDCWRGAGRQDLRRPLVDRARDGGSWQARFFVGVRLSMTADHSENAARSRASTAGIDRRRYVQPDESSRDSPLATVRSRSIPADDLRMFARLSSKRVEIRVRGKLPALPIPNENGESRRAPRRIGLAV